MPFGILVIGHYLLYHFPKAGRVVVVHQVGKFVNKHIVNHLGRGKQQAHGDDDVAVARAMPPKAGGVFHGDVLYIFTEVAVVEFVNALGNHGQKKLAEAFCHQVRAGVGFGIFGKALGQ